MRHIVAATDFSSRSQRALRRAGLLAAQTGAELTIIHVVDDDQPRELVEMEVAEAAKFLNEQTVSLGELRGVRCHARTMTGEGFVGIIEAAKSVSADLIVMGSHRKQVLRDVFVGTTLERVIRTGSYPVLMVNKPAEHPYRWVLAAVDLSDASAHAVRTAVDMRLFDDAAVTVAHAFAAPGQGKMYVSSASREQIDAYVNEERALAAREVAAFLAAQGLSPTHWKLTLEEGGPYEVIERLVAQTNPDLVVVGTHGHSALVRALIGSVAEAILRRIDVDILAVPPKA